jgi:uncharacterized protein (TIGR03084 family)
VTDLANVVRDLGAEHRVLDEMVAGLAPETWSTPTPAEGWTVADQVTHIAHYDDRARVALTDADEFARLLEQDFGSGVIDMDAHLETGRAMAPEQLLDWSRTAHSGALRALSRADPTTRVPWYGPPMSVRSFAAARLMETWAHGRDVADGLGVTQAATARLRHVADLGIRTRAWAYQVHGREAPATTVHVALRAPDDEHWTWGPADAEDRIEGDAEDFCLVVTQRRNVADTALTLAGETAREWMEIAQAFAGPAGTGRPPS